MKRLLSLVMTLILAIAASTPVEAAQIWEPMATASAQAPAQTDDAPAIELSVRGGEIVMNLQRKLTVEVFTILGQPVSRETLQPGAYRLKLRTRGIFILRAGGLTRRITI